MTARLLLLALAIWASGSPVLADSGQVPAVGLASPAAGAVRAVDPFADLVPAAPLPPAARGDRADPAHPPRRTKTLFRQELLAQVTWQDGKSDPFRRFSYGGEILQRFSDRFRTWGSFNAQLQLTHRARFLPTSSDLKGGEREGWFLEHHNLFFDHFNALDTFLAPNARPRHLGRFNARIGRFFLPHGINLQTNTHATLLQLSNARNFGFKRDWGVGLWGALSSDFSYDLSLTAGSGHSLKREGQRGLLGLRVRLASRYLFEYGWEGGLSLMTGERIAKHSMAHDHGRFIRTRRAGLDARHTRPLDRGTLTLIGEWSAGQDDNDEIVSQLYQVEFLRRDRRLGYALQYRRFRHEREVSAAMPAGMGMGMGMMGMPAVIPGPVDASLVGEVTWYFRNETDGINLHWVKLNVERQTERQSGKLGTLTTLQYYRSW